MTNKEPMTEAELREWAEKVQEHSAAARGVLRLLIEIAALRTATYDDGELVIGPALNSRPVLPDKPFDGSTGTPEHKRAGYINPPAPGTHQ